MLRHCQGWQEGRSPGPPFVHPLLVLHMRAVFLLACEWELTNNDTFEVKIRSSTPIVQLQQRQGLPIGGHLSAAFIELVALRRVCQCSWPPMLMNVPTARYRGNVFVVLSDEPSVAERLATARMLSDLPMMPVGFKRGGRVARCLELRIDWSDACKVKAVHRRRQAGRKRRRAHVARVARPARACGPARAACRAPRQAAELC